MKDSPAPRKLTHPAKRNALNNSLVLAIRDTFDGLPARGLSAERPVIILSENDLEHALLALGCLFAGVPYCPSSPAYSTISQDFAKLRHVLDTLTPGLVFASDAALWPRPAGNAG